MERKTIFQKILVPTDGSFPSLLAQELTAHVAKKLRSVVTVIHVVSHDLMSPEVQRHFAVTDEHYSWPAVAHTPHIEPHGHEVVPDPRVIENIRELTNMFHQRGEQAVKDALALFKEEGVVANSKLVEHADVADTIIDEAQVGDYDLIVMGHSGEKEEELHLGSVAEKVVRQARTPVLIARGKRPLEKILVPIDGSERADKALQYAATLAGKLNSAISLLYVQESSVFTLRPKMTKALGNGILSGAAAKIQGLKVNKMLESGDPAKVIAATADQGNFGLIVMGSRGRGTVGRFFLGSVSDHVSHYAASSVLIVK
jgi:nucleotide-binding universal stress UspA family protein